MRDAIEIDRYTYHCFSSRDASDVVVFLYDDHSQVIGQVFAVPDGEPLPPAEQHEGRATLYFRRGAIPQIVDLLRNEKPVYLLWNDGRNTALATGYEPVGEGENA